MFYKLSSDEQPRVVPESNMVVLCPECTVLISSISQLPAQASQSVSLSLVF